MRLKNVLKIIGALGASVGSLAAINKGIFALAKGHNSEFENGEYYKWKYGQVHYKKNGVGKPVVLLHGLTIGASHCEFAKNIDALSQKYTVYALDLPGFGYSDKPKITYTAFTYASFINDFITEIVGEPCMVIASNGSGMFATITAKLFSQNITRLTLISPNGISDEMAKNSDFYHRTMLELPLHGTTVYNYLASRKIIKQFLLTDGFYSPENVDKAAIDAFYYPAHGTSSDARYAYASFATKYMNMDIKGYFENLKMPICIIWGEEHTSNPIENMDILKELQPLAEFYIFEDTKMFPHYENAEEFNSLIMGKKPI
ncbi:MAG: alpha/beta fold hydrolase [Lachnospiraceae bacterium]|nr:alpha/beta fold hydrolase [Lachnospiraceae bacterium]